ncbi:putative G3BP-like protein [Bienertia sinuspersici]
MATSYMTAAQVGSYFVTQYYSMLQQRPEFVHQLYSDASTMLRIDGHTRETATAMLEMEAKEGEGNGGMIYQKFQRLGSSFGSSWDLGHFLVYLLFVEISYDLHSSFLLIMQLTNLILLYWQQIHALVMSMRFTAIEIKTAHSLESWNGGVVVMVTGSLQIRDVSGRKKFAQTFFLAPQEKGFFVLNDIFHFIEDDQVHPYSASLIGQTNLSANLNAPASIPEAVPNYMMTAAMQARDYMPPGDVKENGTVDKYSIPEQRLQQAPEVESILEDNSREQTNGFLASPMTLIQDIPQAQIEDPVEEMQKHTYASVLRAAKVQAAPSVAPSSSSNKAVAPASEWQHAPQHNDQQSVAQQAQQQSSSVQVASESWVPDVGDEVSTTDDRGEIKSVYVRNLSPTISASEIEDEFVKFGQLTSEGVAIRRLKDTDVCYAFVEFEDIASVQSAIKAGSVQIAGRQVYIEERRANSSFARGRRGRGRATYQPDSSRGRFGCRSYNRGGGQVGEFNRSRGNAHYRQTTRQDKGYSVNQVS